MSQRCESQTSTAINFASLQSVFLDISSILVLFDDIERLADQRWIGRNIHQTSQSNCVNNSLIIKPKKQFDCPFFIRLDVILLFRLRIQERDKD